MDLFLVLIMRFIKLFFILSVLFSFNLFAQSSASSYPTYQQGDVGNCVATATNQACYTVANAYTYLCGTTASYPVCKVIVGDSCGANYVPPSFSVSVYKCPAPSSSSSSSIQSSSSASSCQKVFDSVTQTMVCYKPCMDSVSGCPASSAAASSLPDCGSGPSIQMIGGQTICAPSSSPSNSSSGTASSASGSVGNSSAASGSTGSNNTGNNSNNNSGNNSSVDASNCIKNFGANNCQAVADNMSCPNSYIDATGQKWCVASPNHPNPSSEISISSTPSRNATPSQCSTRPICSGDQIDCAVLNQIWESSCITDGQNEIDSLTQTFKDSAEADIQKYTDDKVKDVSDFASGSGVIFGTAPNGLKAALLAYVPQPTSCVPIQLKTKYFDKTIDCTWFDIFKSVFAWFLSVMTAFYIWSLATKPVE